MRKGHIWISVDFGVIGFQPEELAAFEKEYRQFIHSKEEYWAAFNHRFESDLDGKRAYAFSALWNTPAEWQLLRQQHEIAF